MEVEHRRKDGEQSFLQHAEKTNNEGKRMSFHALILQVSRRVSSFILVPAQYYLVTNMPCHKGIKRLGLKKKKIKMKKKKSKLFSAALS